MLTQRKHEFNEEHIPIAYLITFRTYGTWLHGDKRGSVDRHQNRYGSPRLPRSDHWYAHNLDSLKQPPVKLNAIRRQAVRDSIRMTCKMRDWSLWTTNVRSNHVHIVVSVAVNPKKVINALKANATRVMKETGCWRESASPWVRGGSKKYLWTEKEVADAIAYVEYDQGEPLD